MSEIMQGNVFGKEKPTESKATPNEDKAEFNKHYGEIVQTQQTVARSPSVSPPLTKTEMVRQGSSQDSLPFSNKWKVSILTGSVGTGAKVSFWLYGSRGTNGPITLGKDGQEQIFQPQQEDEFIVNVPKIGKLYKIRIEYDGKSDQQEWKLQRVALQKIKNGKTYYFEVSKWLLKSRGEYICEIPVVENGKFVYPIVTYQVNVYTGPFETAGTDAPVYICIHGENGDTGKRLLFKSDSLNIFHRGQLDVFEIEAVSLGKLEKIHLGCEANHKSQYWHCEKVIIREQGKDSEYIFNCERWLPFMSEGVLCSEVELRVEEMQITNRAKELDEEYEGVWKVTVITGDFQEAATDATVFLYVYGEGTNSGPIILGSGVDQLFNMNSEDTFQVNLNHVDKPYKIRIGHDNSGENPNWYLEGVRLQNLRSEEEFYLPMNRWLAEEKDDGDTWRELALTTNGGRPLPLLDYEIHVYTGALSSPGIDSNIYINIIGRRGDSGKRKLHRSQNQKAMFQKEQVDIFIIQAVSLGSVQKIKISRDGSGHGSGWFLDKIMIHYAEDDTDYNILFPCNRWLSVHEEDEITEIELFASEEENPKQLIKDNKWNIKIKTAKDSSLMKNMKVQLVIYGSEGKTNIITLLPQAVGTVSFLPDAVDDFFVEFENVGEIYKIRIVCNDLPVSLGWHLRHLHMKQLQTEQEIYIDCDCWLSVEAEREDIVKEFPVINNQQKTLPVYEYMVAVHIGDHWGAETSANVYITLYGDRGDSGARKLHKSSLPGEKFARNKVDYFLVEAVSLGKLRKVVLGHDGDGYGAGPYLKMVTVKESKESSNEWVFPCWNWLDNHLGLYETVCKLQTIGWRLSMNPNPIAQSGGLWIIDITGTDFDRSDIPAQFDIWFYGDKDKEKLEAKIAGNTIQIEEELKNIGSLYKVRFSWSNIQLKKAWHLASMHMKHTVTNQEMWLIIDSWIKPNEDKCVEIPAIRPNIDPLPVVEYTIYLHTGDVMNAGATGTVYICIEGENGDTGNRTLSISGSDVLSFNKGQVDTFQIKAVHIGKLQRIVVGFRSSTKDAWFLEKVIVKETEFSFTKYVFVHNDWITCDVETELVESLIALTELNSEKCVVKASNEATKGKWIMRVLGMPQEDEDMDISVVIFGRTDKSPLLKVKNLNYNPFLLNVGNVGEIIKVSFLSTNQSSERRLQLQKVRLRDADTKQEVGFYPEDAYLSHEDGSESVIEMPAIFPNIPPLSVIFYSVRIRTGSYPASGTDADIVLTVFGENGDTCKRKLRHIFGQGKVNIFDIKAVDLGMLTKVQIEHNAVGYGAGWYLDDITIQDSNKRETKYWFPCQQWLDTGIGDKQTQCELKLLGKVNENIHRLSISAEGVLDVMIVSDEIQDGGSNFEVSLTICCEKGNYEPVVFAGHLLKQGGTSQTTIELNRDLGAIHKVRLQMEGDLKGINWFCKEVKLHHKESNEYLEFPFLQLFTNDGKNCSELPALSSVGPALSVKTYTIYITAVQSMKLTADTFVYITLRGSLGDSGRRRFPCKKSAFTNKTKTARFQLECVDIGAMQEMFVGRENQTNLQMEKAVVEEGNFITKKYIFAVQQWRKEKHKNMSMTLPVTEVKEGSAAEVLNNGNQPMTSDGKWIIHLTTSTYEQLQPITDPVKHNANLVLVLYGNKGKSNPIILENNTVSQVKGLSVFKIDLAQDLGELYKVRLGLEKWDETARLSLNHLKMQHTKTLDTFNYSICQTLPLSLNGDGWIEIPIEWPLKSSLSVVTYYVNVLSTGTQNLHDGFELSVCLHGKNGDSGDRHLTWQKSQDKNGKELLTAILQAVEIGDLYSSDISISSKSDCQLHITNIFVKESSKKEISVFEVNQDFLINANEPKIRKQVLLSQVIRDEHLNQKQNKALDADQMENTEDELAEYLIKVYTGDVRGAGTYAHVQISLFGYLDSFGPIELNQPMEDQNPFQRGKLDTFKILTNNLGRIVYIKVGHDGKGFAHNGSTN
ncbi:lipoxygenase homology domain-containing 1-like [Pelobates cultripes]|uniref:Lipoxygenase homology domain-containing 1-like n=1 Tax=Pelobates cultripes TaxID=61616 RepID=A0AAD1S0V8_PELCU|nr:lipoxygenase homology domain-containing 1-like [Pelobates cultripes]